MCDDFEANYFMDRCLTLDHEMETVMAIFSKVYKDMQKKAKQLIITCSFSKSSVYSSAMHCVV